MLNLDTHIFVYALCDELTPTERKLLRKNEWAISAIVLWELSKLVSLGRLEIDLHSIEFSRILAQTKIIPLTLGIAIKSTDLDFSSDPADEIIGATSVVHKIPLMTRDRRILKSKVVPLA